jgi:hypothetical protein
MPRHKSKPRSPAYISWAAMLTRCNNPRQSDWHSYGGRGIKVCERWRSFKNFFADMGERPKGKTLDRYPNSGGNYEPGNCRWATANQQARNRRRSVMVSHDGKCLNISDWADLLGIRPSKLKIRYYRGFRPPELFFPGNFKTGPKPKHPNDPRL